MRDICTILSALKLGFVKVTILVLFVENKLLMFMDRDEYDRDIV